MERTQRIVEGQSYGIRTTLLKYSQLVEQQRAQYQLAREEFLSPGTASEWLKWRDLDLWSKLIASRDAGTLDRALQSILLAELDEAWAEHLAMVAEIKEGIYQYSVGGRGLASFKVEPIDAFRSALPRAFSDMQRQAERCALDRMKAVAALGNGEWTPEEVGIKRPTATWTYLVSDDPFADIVQNVVTRFRSAFRAEGSPG
ncbi:MAG TPA: hypothetical protein VMK12_17225 [Anaeromyxobacteraceae bacterium]|nr:hypothetical protein [Anaeromyxobacteraceae bacterium]